MATISKEDLKKVLSIHEAAEALGVSESTIHRYLNSGKLSGFKTGDNTAPWRFEPEEIARYKRGQTKTEGKGAPVKRKYTKRAK